jgi:antitoxin (DNA-binding transcriptional repressor) of toxin-antitoxin stability system
MEIGVRELRRDLAARLRQAGAGQRIVVTAGGRAVAALGPVTSAPPVGPPTIEDLAARGLVVPARRGDRPRPDVVVPLRVGARLDRLVAEIRA